MLPVMQLGPFSVPSSALILLIGLWLGLVLSERYAKGSHQEIESLGNLLFYSVAAALLGARLGYAMRYPSAFMDSPASLISLNAGLLDPWSATAGALIFGLVYGQRKDLKLWATLDNLTVGLAMIGVALGLSQLASGQGYGLPSDVPWAIELWGTARHPSQIYETLAAALVLVFVLRMQRESRPRAGLLFLQFVALSAGARLYLEAFRSQGLLLPNGWRIAQIVAWLILALSLWAYWQLTKESQSSVR